MTQEPPKINNYVPNITYAVSYTHLAAALVEAENFSDCPRICRRFIKCDVDILYHSFNVILVAECTCRKS